MGAFLIISALLKLALGLGFAYIIWVLAAKESGTSRTTGMVISIAVIILVLISAIYGAHSFKRMHHKFGSEPCITNSSTNESSGAAKETIKHRPAHSWKKHLVK